MIQAKNVMHQSTPVLDFDATVGEAIETMRRSPTGFLAVRASSDRYQGVLTEAALVRLYLRFQAGTDQDSMILHRDLFEPLQLIHEDEVFPEVVKKLLTAVGHRVFVINDKTEVVGYITAKDVLPYFTTDPQATPEADGERLRSDLYLYESFFEKSPFMMHSVNKDGVIQMANEVLHAVLGYDYGELIGRTIFDLYEKDNQKKAEDGLKTIFREGYHQVVRSTMLTKAGQKIDVELVSRALTNQFDQPVGTMTVSRPLEMGVLLQSWPRN